MLEAMDRREISLLVLLDLSKCFDVIDHQKLIQKLELYGVETTWFRSYLSDHRQRVRLTGGRTTGPGSAGEPARRRSLSGPLARGPKNISDPLPNPMGVYQGTGLGPLLYNVFSADLSLYLEQVKIFQYADDTQLLISGQKTELPSLVRRMESALETVSQWFAQNHMKLNAAKSQLLVLENPKILGNIPKITLSMQDTTIHESDTVRNLGLVMDRGLSFDMHVKSVCGRCTGILIGLARVRHCVPKRVLPKLVNGFVFSLIRYCLPIYGSCKKENHKRLQRVVNFGARVISGRRKRDHISDITKKLKWLPISKLYSFHTLCLLKRLLQNGEPRSLARGLARRRDVRPTQTRQNDKLDLPKIRTEYGRRRFYYRTADAFNRLPAQIIESRIGAFKRRLERYLDAD